MNRIASFIGENTLISSSTGIIKELVESKIDWKHRVAGYLFLGMISEACTETFLKNMDDVIRMSANGLLDEHPRVRYEALTSLGLLLTSLAPDAQLKYHADLMTILLKMMKEEEYVKLQTRATSAMVNFVRGLIDESGDAEDRNEENAKILEPYADALMETLYVLFGQSEAKNYAPLQEEVLSLLSCAASVIQSKFSKYYQSFMPALKQIVASAPRETQQQ